MGKLLIGWSSVSITPERKVPLAGQFHKRIADQVRDPVMATVLAIESEADGGEQVVLVGCDLVAIELPLLNRVRERMSRLAPEITPESVILSASHTHTGPLYADCERLPALVRHTGDPDVMPYGEYVEFAAERIAGAIRDAWASRAPGGVGRARGAAALGFNRMVVYDDDTATMYGDIYTSHFRRMVGPEDPRVEMLFTWNGEGELTGVLFSAACPAQIAENQTLVSADYFGELRSLVALRWSPSVKVLGLIGAAGDLAPRDTLNQRHNERDYNKELRTLALRLFHTLEMGLEDAKLRIATEAAFAHKLTRLELPLRKPTKSEVEAARRHWQSFATELAKHGDQAEFFLSHSFDEQNRIFNSFAILQRNDVLKRSSVYPMELHAIRLDDMAIVTNSFELFTEFGLRIKARSCAKLTFIAQLSNNSSGYLPTASAMAAGGYSALLFCGYVGSDAGDMLVDRTVEAIRELWNDKE